MTERQQRSQADRDFYLEMGRQLERRDAEIAWYKSSLVALLTIARENPSPLTSTQVASICETTLSKYKVDGVSGERPEPGEGK